VRGGGRKAQKSPEDFLDDVRGEFPLARDVTGGAAPDPRIGELHLDDAVRPLQDEDLRVALPDLFDEGDMEGVG
jgi:hypothetical protein